MGDDHDHGSAKSDPDRAAILARRKRFIAMALTGLTATTAAACNEKGPCLKVSAEPADTAKGKPEPAPHPCLNVAAPDPVPQPCLEVVVPDPVPQPCLDVAAPDPEPKPPPQPCLKVHAPDKPVKPESVPTPCLNVAREDPPKPPPHPCLKVAKPR